MRNNLSGLLVIGLLLAFVGWFFWPTIEGILTPPTLPRVAPPVVSFPNLGASPTPVLNAQATAQAGRAVPVPTQEYAFIKANDLVGLQKYLDGKAQNWSSVSQNVWTMDIAGVAPWSLTNSALGGTHAITWTAVWKGNATGGLNSQFGLPTVTLNDDWVEVQRTQSITQTNLTLVEMQTTATVTFTGKTCVTGVEHWDFTPIHTGEPNSAPILQNPGAQEWAVVLDPLNHRSYSIWTGESTTGLFPPRISLDDHLYVRQMAEGTAKVIAHENARLEQLLGLVETSAQPGGRFYTDQILPNFSEEIASLYRVRGFTIVVNLTRLTDGLGRTLRCDGTPVLR